MIALDGYIMR